MADWTLEYKEQQDNGELSYLDPCQLQFDTRGDALRVTIADDRTYLKVHAVRAFPLTELNDFIGLLDAVSGREIGLIRSMRDLDGPARSLVQAELNRRYFIPKISRIHKATKEFGSVYWDVDTDRGRRQFVMRGIRDSIHEIESDRFLVTDIDGNRFEVPCISSLDNRSQQIWDKLI
jgi:hypothetical protein